MRYNKLINTIKKKRQTQLKSQRLEEAERESKEFRKDHLKVIPLKFNSTRTKPKKLAIKLGLDKTDTTLVNDK